VLWIDWRVIYRESRLVRIRVIDWLRLAIAILAGAALLGYWLWPTTSHTPSTARHEAAFQESTVLPAAPPAPRVTAHTAGSAPVDARELCGYGSFQTSKTWTGLPEEVDAAAHKALAQVATQLQGGDERSQALGISLRLALRKVETPPIDAGQGAAHAARLREAQVQVDRAAAPDRAALVRLAHGTRDAEVYRLAYLACEALRHVSDDPHCRQLTALEWARRDPAEGLAWAYAIREAQAANDRAAVDEAVHQLAQAKRMSLAGIAFGRLSDHSTLQALPVSTQIAAAFGLMWFTSLSGGPPMIALLSYCEKEAVSEPTRRERCNAAGRFLASSDGSPMGLMTAAQLGSNLGWQAAEVKELRDKVTMLTWAESQLQKRLPSATTCAGFSENRRYLSVFGSSDQLTLLEQQIRDTGISRGELVQRIDDERRRRVDEACKGVKKQPGRSEDARLVPSDC
jgi:hypothetical protein